MFRRSLALLLVVLAAVSVMAGTASANGKDVMRDLKADGVIDKCYSAAEFTRALELARNEDAQYAATVDAIREKKAECNGTAAPAPVDAGAKKDGGSNTALWAIVVAALAAGAVAFGVAARKRRDDDVGS
jgi:Tfp pilus assembly protein FimT